MFHPSLSAFLAPAAGSVAASSSSPLGGPDSAEASQLAGGSVEPTPGPLGGRLRGHGTSERPHSMRSVYRNYIVRAVLPHAARDPIYSLALWVVHPLLVQRRAEVPAH